MPIDWAHNYGFDGWMGYRDAAAEKSYILGAEDGVLQAVLNEDGTIRAAGGNIELGNNGLRVHDLSNASIISPAFGVGWIHDTLPSSEDFTAWTAGGTASVTGNTQQGPNGESTIADTIALSADGDYVTTQTIASPTLANGQSAACMVYLKAASAGTIRLQVGTSSGGDEVGTLDFSVETEWRRAVLIVTNGTGDAIRPYVTIKRSGAGQLASVYAWGAQMAYNVSKETPYYSLNPGGDKKWGVSMRGPLFVTYESLGSVIIGNSFSVLPTGTRCVSVGSQAGDNSTGNYVYAIGHQAAWKNTGSEVIAIGGGYNNTYNKVILIGNTGTTATANQQIVFGSDSLEYLEMYLGGGSTQSSPPDFAINATGGSGTNIAGGDLSLAGGKGTGTGTGGSLLFKTAPAGGSGTSLNSLTTRMTIDTAGVVDVEGDTLRISTTKTPSSASATGTVGDICWDSSYIYVCVAANTWKRTAIATW